MSGTYAEPNTLCMRFQTCDYCSKVSIRDYYSNNSLHGLMACAEHGEMAKRDIKAYYARINVVKLEDFLTLFPEMAEKTYIVVPRTDGSTTEGGSLLLSDLSTSYSFVSLANDGEWRIPVKWNCEKDGLRTKGVKLKDLSLSGVLDADIMKMIDSLEAGFYKTDLEAHMAAVSSGQMKPFVWVPGISLGINGENICRVLNH